MSNIDPAPIDYSFRYVAQAMVDYLDALPEQSNPKDPALLTVKSIFTAALHQLAWSESQESAAAYQLVSDTLKAKKTYRHLRELEEDLREIACLTDRLPSVTEDQLHRLQTFYQQLWKTACAKTCDEYGSGELSDYCYPEEIFI